MSDKKTLLNQLRHMADRLQEEVRRMPEEPLIIEYDNGGGQAGVRENPYYAAYEKLLASYVKTLAAVKGMGAQDAEVNQLDALRTKLKVVK